MKKDSVMGLFVAGAVGLGLSFPSAVMSYKRRKSEDEKKHMREVIIDSVLKVSPEYEFASEDGAIKTLRYVNNIVEYIDPITGLKDLLTLSQFVEFLDSRDFQFVDRVQNAGI